MVDEYCTNNFLKELIQKTYVTQLDELLDTNYDLETLIKYALALKNNTLLGELLSKCTKDEEGLVEVDIDAAKICVNVNNSTGFMLIQHHLNEEQKEELFDYIVEHLKIPFLERYIKLDNNLKRFIKIIHHDVVLKTNNLILFNLLLDITERVPLESILDYINAGRYGVIKTLYDRDIELTLEECDIIIESGHLNVL